MTNNIGVDVVSFLASNMERDLKLENQKSVLNLLSTTRRIEKSRSGFPKDVLLSALQKACRRGELAQSFYIAIELESFSDVVGGKAIVTNFMNRLRVILVEEVSLAYPMAVIEFDKFYEIYCNNRATNDEYLQKDEKTVETFNKKKKNRLVALLQAVQILVLVTNYLFFKKNNYNLYI